MGDFGRIFITIGIVLIIIGVLFQLTPLFKLPGDIIIKKGNFTFFFPIVTSILLSILLTI